MCWTLDRVKEQVQSVKSDNGSRGPSGPIEWVSVGDKSTFYLREVAVKMELKSKRRKV